MARKDKKETPVQLDLRKQTLTHRVTFMATRTSTDSGHQVTAGDLTFAACNSAMAEMYTKKMERAQGIQPGAPQPKMWIPVKVERRGEHDPITPESATEEVEV